MPSVSTLLGQTIADQRFHTMIIRAEASQLHLFSVLDLLGVTVAPFNRHVGVRIGVYQDIECAVPVQDRKKRNGGGDLAEDGLDLVLDFLLGFLDDFWLALSA